MPITVNGNPTPFTKIYEAACAQDLAALKELAKVTTLSVKQGAQSVLVQLLLDGKNDAVTLLKENFSISKIDLVRAYAMVNAVDEVNEILDSARGINEPLRYLESAIEGYSYCENHDEIKKIFERAKAIPDYLPERDDIILESCQAIGLVMSNQTIPYLILLHSEPRVLNKVVYHLGLQGDVDMINQLVAKKKTLPIANTILENIIIGLARGNYPEKVDTLLQSCPTPIDFDVIIAKYQGLVSGNHIDFKDVKEWFATVDPTHKLKSLLALATGYMQSGYFASAKKLISVTKVKEEKEALTNKLIKLWVAGRYYDEAIDFIKNTFDVNQMHVLHRTFVAELLTFFEDEYVYELLENESDEAKRIIFLEELMLYHVNYEETENIKKTLSLCSNKNQITLVTNKMLYGCVKENKNKIAENYFSKITDKDERMRMFLVIAKIYFALGRENELVNVKNLRKADEEYEWLRVIVLAYTHKGDGKGLNDFLKSMKDNQFSLRLLHRAVFEYGLTGETTKLFELLNCWSVEICLKVYVSAVEGFVKSNKIEGAMQLYKFASTSIQRIEAIKVAGQIVHEMSLLGNIQVILQVLSNMIDLDELSQVFKYIKPKLYECEIFATVKSSIKTLASMKDESIRKSFAKALSEHKKTPEYQATALLFAVTKMLSSAQTSTVPTLFNKAVTFAATTPQPDSRAPSPAPT